MTVAGEELEVRMRPSGAVSLATTDAQSAQPALDALRRAGVTVSRFHAVRPTLEDLFIDAVTNRGVPMPVS